MKSRVRYNLSSSEEKAMKAELKRQFQEFDRRHTLELDALVLWSLHEQLGYGKKRLKRFYERFNKSLKEMGERYDFDDADKIWLCQFKLKEIGIDIEEWDRDRKRSDA